MSAVLLTLSYVLGAWVGLAVLLAVGWAVMRTVQRKRAGQHWTGTHWAVGPRRR